MTKKYKMPYFNEYVWSPLFAFFSLSSLILLWFILTIFRGEKIQFMIEDIVTSFPFLLISFLIIYLFFRVDLRYYVFEKNKLICKNYFGFELKYINFNEVREIGIREIPKKERHDKYSKLFPYVLYFLTDINPMVSVKSSTFTLKRKLDYLEVFYTLEKLQYIREHYDKDIVSEEIVKYKNNSVSIMEERNLKKTSNPIKNSGTSFHENKRKINEFKLVLPFLGYRYTLLSAKMIALLGITLPLPAMLTAIMFGVIDPFTIENLIIILLYVTVGSIVTCFSIAISLVLGASNKVLDSYYVVTKDSITYKSFLGRTQNKIMFKDLIEVGIVKDSYNKFSEFYPYKIYFITNKEVYNDAVNNAIFERVYPGYIQVFCDFNKLKAIKRFYKGYIKDEWLILEHYSKSNTKSKILRLKRKNIISKENSKIYSNTQ